MALMSPGSLQRSLRPLATAIIAFLVLSLIDNHGLAGFITSGNIPHKYSFGTAHLDQRARLLLDVWIECEELCSSLTE